MSKQFNLLKPYLDKSVALNIALTSLSFDLDTLAPKKALPYTSQAMALLAKENYETLINEDVSQIVNECLKANDLTDIEKAIVKEVNKNYDKLNKIPSDLYTENTRLEREAQSIWEEAKDKKDFSIFAPYLKKIIANQRKFIELRSDASKSGYNVLLDDYEPGFSIDVLDKFFEQLKEEIVPLIKALDNKNDNIDTSFLSKSYPIEKQKEFNLWIANYIGFDLSRGLIKESAHPYTTNLHKYDVRFTTHYYENQLDSAMFATLHEAGHGKYEQGIHDDITMSIVGGGTSMGMHESQSRFFENCVGRNKYFLKPVFEKLQKTFNEQLSKVSFEDFYKAVNKFQPSLIRIEADELTYPLHIMIRYEIEKKIFNNEVEVDDLPELWNQLSEEYLGLRPKNDAEGILQDVHWGSGAFGYFPSCALGSAIAAQILHHIKSIYDFDALIADGDFEDINQYLETHIHQYGKMKTTQEILSDMIGERFDASYYIDYLKEKFQDIYG